MVRRLSVAGAAALVWTLGLSAFAAPPPLPPGAAELREGKLLMAQGKLEQACTKLAEAQALSAKATTQLELATCREKQGRRADAHRLVTAALAQARSTKDRATEQLATARLGKLAPTIGTLVVTAADPDAALTLDGAAFGAELLGTPYAVDPGEYVVAASAPKKRPRTTTVKVAAREEQRVAMPALEPESVALAAAADAIAPSAPAVGEPEREPEEEQASSSRLVVEVGGIVGVLVSGVDRAPTSALGGLEYQLPTPGGGVLIAGCGDTTTVPGAGECEGTFDVAAGGAAGGTLFVGWSVLPRLHVGARGFGAAGIGGGFAFGGGPAASWRAAGPVWLGVEGALAYEEHPAALRGARGSVPEAYASAAGGAEVDVPLGAALGREVTVSSGMMGAVALDVSLALFGMSEPALLGAESPVALLDGAMMLSLRPTLFIGPGGLGASVPLSLGYRFF